MRTVLGRFFSAVIAAGMIFCLFHFGGSILRQTSNDTLVLQVETFHSLPEYSLDVIVYGSSRAWRNVNVMTMYEKYGIGAYNYGSSWQHFNTTALYFYDSLLTQSPRVAVIETSMVDKMLPDEDMDAEVLATMPIRNTSWKRQYLRECFGNDINQYLAYYIPFVSFHANWTSLSRNSFMDNGSPKDFLAHMGYHDLASVQEPQTLKVKLYDEKKFEQYELPERSLQVLDDILQTCRNHRIKVIFFTAPYRDEYHYRDAMTAYARDNNCIYLDMFEKLEDAGIDPATDFWDTGHLNNSGASKLGDYIGQVITDNYLIPDMRTVEGNLWSQSPLLSENQPEDQSGEPSEEDLVTDAE